MFWVFVAESRGYSLAAVHELLIAVGLLIAEDGALGTQAPVAAVHGLHCCDSWALEHRLSSCGAQI